MGTHELQLIEAEFRPCRRHRRRERKGHG